MESALTLIKLGANIDEFRVWKRALSENEIRINMCRKYDDNEPDLVVYYTFDQILGNQIINESGNAPNGNLINGTNQSFIESGAYIGSESVFSYSGSNLSIISNQGDLNVSGDFTISGIHIYKISSLPNNLQGTVGLADNQTFFGIYSTNNNSVSLNFDYSNYTTVNSNPNDLVIFTQSISNSSSWNVLNGVSNLGNGSLTTINTTLPREIILGGIDQSVVIPSMVGAGNTLDFKKNQSQFQYVSLGTSNILKPSQNITIEAWIKPRSLSQWEDAVLSNAQDNGTNESGYSFSYVGSKLRFLIKPQSLAGNAWNNNPGYEVPLDKWSHIVGTYNGSQIKFYYNGIMVESRNATGPINWDFTPLDARLGMFLDDNEEYQFDGFIDEVRI